MNILKDIKNINTYIFNPYHNVDVNYNFSEKCRILSSSLLYALVFAGLFVLVDIPWYIDKYIVNIEFVEGFNKISITGYLLSAVLFAPLVEEFFFRLPLKYDNNYLFQVIQRATKYDKLEVFWIKYFKAIFYFFSFAFAIGHALVNCQNDQLIFYLLIPLLVLSQGFGGLVIGYVRMHLGFRWAILKHALFNFTLFALSLYSVNEVVLQHTDNTIELEIVALNYYEENEVKQLNFDKNTIISIDWNDETIQKLLDTLYNSKYKTYDNHLAKVKLTTKQPISKEAFLNILKEEYRIVKRD